MKRIREILSTAIVWFATTLLLSYMLESFLRQPLPHISQLVSTTQSQQQLKSYLVEKKAITGQNTHHITVSNTEGIPIHNKDWCIATCVCNNRLLQVHETFTQSGEYELEYVVRISNNTDSMQECGINNFFLSVRDKEDAYHELMSVTANALKTHTPKSQDIKDVVQNCHIDNPYKNADGLSHASRDWVGFTQLYWVFAAQPLHDACCTPVALTSPDHSMSISGWHVTSNHILAPHESKQFTHKIFLGPKTQTALASNTATFAQLDMTTDLGYFAILIRPLFNLIIHLAKWIGMSYIPHILLAIAMLARVALCARYGWINIKDLEKLASDPTRSMHVARRWFANTLLQCITSLILYKICFVIPEATTQGIGWIRNLNAPDTYHLLNGFGYFAGWGLLSIITSLCIVATILNQMTERSLSGQSMLDQQVVLTSLIMLIMDRTPVILGLLYLSNTLVSVVYNLLLLALRGRGQQSVL